ncbi:Vesicle transport protein [Durusdinium trenchii]|uniref:Vesicle transport protein n=1 Tax=Durusdinium trenchii TaxID=1381693 RepID=A0ABP0MSL6_9DINO
MAGHGYLAVGLLALLPSICLAAYVGLSRVFRQGMPRKEAALCWTAMVLSLSFPLTCGYVGRHKRWSTLVMEIEESLVDEFGHLCLKKLGVIGAFGLCNYICLALRPPFRAALSGGDGFDREGVMAAVLVFTSVLGAGPSDDLLRGEDRSSVAEEIKNGSWNKTSKLPIEQKLREELKQTAEKLRGSEQEKRRLQERNEELQLAFEEADKDAREAEALNGHLQRRVDEMEVQIAALRQYESEFDQKVTKMLDERDEALTLAAKDKEAILLKVKELQEELAMQKSPGSNLADASELAMMLKERQLEIEDLLDRNEELEEAGRDGWSWRNALGEFHLEQTSPQ